MCALIIIRNNHQTSVHRRINLNTDSRSKHWSFEPDQISASASSSVLAARRTRQIQVEGQQSTRKQIQHSERASIRSENPSLPSLHCIQTPAANIQVSLAILSLPFTSLFGKVCVTGNNGSIQK